MLLEAHVISRCFCVGSGYKTFPLGNPNLRIANHKSHHRLNRELQLFQEEHLTILLFDRFVSCIDLVEILLLRNSLDRKLIQNIHPPTNR